MTVNPPKEDFDLVVIGSGPAGEKGAVTAALLGKRVAVIEKAEQLGGSSTNTGTIPSKTLRETALALTGLNSRNLYRVDLSLRREVTIRDLMYHEKRVQAEERRRIQERFDNLGIRVFHGEASFVDTHTLEIRRAGGILDTQVTAKKTLIAVGAGPFRPREFNFDHPFIFDSDSILSLHSLPKTLAVVGAGVIGSEYARTFAALGYECI